MGVDPFALADELRQRAQWVHDRATQAAAVNQDLFEETITQEVLIDLARRFPGEVSVRTFSKHQEARNGADWHWEWWWSGRTAWFGARVQAKRLRPLRRDIVGYHLDYQSGDGLQVDKLLRSAGQAGFPALYVLYNGPLLDLGTFPWRCPATPAYAPAMGVGLLAAETAEVLARRHWIDQGSVNSFAVPWSCLATCRFLRCHPWPRWFDPADPSTYGFPPGTARSDLAFIAARAVSAARWRSYAAQFRDARSIDTDDVPHAVVEPPRYVLGGPSDINQDTPDDLAGVVIIRSDD